MFYTIYEENKKQWSGPKTEPIFNPRTSLGNVILNALEVNGSRVAQICANTNKHTTYEELRALTIRVAKKFRRFGFEKGQVILFLTDNSADIAPLVFAALCLGCVITSFPVSYTNLEYSNYLNIVRPSFVFCDLECCASLKKCLMDLNIYAGLYTFGGQLYESYSIEKLFEGDDLDPYFIPTGVNGVTDTAFIMATSGTSGPYKGVCMSHAAILDKISRYSPILKSTDILMSISPLYGVANFRTLFGTIINGSTCVVNVRPFSSERFLELIERFKVTYTFLPAYRLTILLNHQQIETANLFSLRLVTSGGQKLPHHYIQKISKYLKGGKYCQAYGMTETVSTVAANLYRSKNDSVGQLISGCEAKIINEQGERLGINEDGELCIKQPFPFLRYLGSENSRSCFDEEGFFATGDIARFDENGDLFINGRKKMMFKCCDVHVNPIEIEEVLNKIDGIELSCIVSIPHPEYTNVPAAVVVKSENSTCTERSIYDAVANTFSAYKWPRGGVFFVDSMPLNESCKIARHVVSKMAIEFHNNGLSTLTDEYNNLDV